MNSISLPWPSGVCVSTSFVTLTARPPTSFVPAVCSARAVSRRLHFSPGGGCTSRGAPRDHGVVRRSRAITVVRRGSRGRWACRCLSRCCHENGYAHECGHDVTGALARAHSVPPHRARQRWRRSPCPTARLTQPTKELCRGARDLSGLLLASQSRLMNGA